MLLTYSIQNFLSIKRECKISFEPAALKTNHKLLMNGQILPVVVIYGANGSGKSSILKSLLNSTLLITANNEANFNINLSYCISAKNKVWINNDTTFVFEFLSETNQIYRYELVISNKSIKIERLSKKDYKTKQTFKLIYEIKDSILSSNDKTLSKLKINNSKVSGLFGLNAITEHNDLKFVCNEFIKFKIYLDNSWSFIVPNFQPNTISHSWNFDIHLLTKYKDIFLKIFKEIDLNIIDIEIAKNPFGGYDIWFHKESLCEPIKLNFFEESTGTQKIIKFLCDFIGCSEKGGVMCIDELDASLHPKLLAYVINIMNSKNNKKVQLLYTSHDLYTLDQEFFRKDEIYFTRLNESYFTDMVCLNEYKSITQNSSYSNQYKNGNIGYEPYIDKVSDWYE